MSKTDKPIGAGSVLVKFDMPIMKAEDVIWCEGHQYIVTYDEGGLMILKRIDQEPKP